MKKSTYVSFINPELTGPRGALFDVNEFVAAFARLDVLATVHVTDGTTRDAEATYTALCDALRVLADLVIEVCPEGEASA